MTDWAVKDWTSTRFQFNDNRTVEVNTRRSLFGLMLEALTRESSSVRDEANSTKTQALDRRTFLKVVGAGSCALVLGPTGCTIAEVFTDGNGVLSFDVSDPVFSGLSDVNGTAVVDSAGRSLILIRTDASTVVALNRICTHQGADMDPAKSGTWDGQRLKCRLHDSYFSSSGQAIEGPATADLTSYPVEFDATAGTGTVTISGEPPEDTNPIPEEYRDLVNPFPADDPDALAAGEVVWAQCSGCHGAEGQGNEAISATAFNGDNSAYADDYLFWRLRTGGATGPAGSIMPAYSEDQLSDTELWQVITYLRSLGQ